jgi:fluoroquinolone transport system permease protein
MSEAVSHRSTEAQKRRGLAGTARALWGVDARGIARDPLLRWMLVYPLALALVVRWVLPPLFARVGNAVVYDLLGIFPEIAAYALLSIPPTLCGMVVGFLLLDERDEGTLDALRVTPVRPRDYVAYRVVVPALMSAAIALVALPLGGFGEIGIAALAGSVTAAALLAPLFALTLAVFAANKVQGFALVKIAGVVGLAPLGALFAGPAWQPLFAVVPSYWPATFLWSALDGDAEWWRVAVGLVHQGLFLALLARRFERNRGV